MALTDEELFDFDKRQLMGWDSAHIERTLTERRDVYRAQLVAARWIDGWRRRLSEDDPVGDQLSEDYRRGYSDALNEVVAHLRQGDLVPGGVLHDDTDAGRL
jgi:hypothetical protein